MASTIGVKMQMDGAAQFKADLQQITQKSKELAAEMKAAASGASDEASKQKILASQIDNARQKIDLLNKKYQSQAKALQETNQKLDEAKKEYGEDSEEARKLTLEVTKQETALSKTKTQINNATDALNKLESETKESTNELKNASNEIETSGSKFEGLGEALKKAAAVGVAALAAIGTAAVAAVKGLVNMAVEVSETGDAIDKNSQKVGLSYKSYQQWDHAMQIAGTSMESCQAGLKTLTNTIDDAKNGSSSAEEKFKRLGISVDDLAGKSREEIFKETITALQNVGDETEKAALANDMFGRSGQELLPLLNMSAEETEALLEETEKYGMIMSDDAVKASADFQDSLTRLDGAMSGLKSRLVSELLPGFSEVVDGLALMAAGSEEGGEKLALGIEHALDGINKMLPKFLEAGGKILTGLVNGISKNLPQILRSALTMVQTLADALVENLPVVVQAISEALPQLIQAAISIVQGICEHIGEIIQPIIEALPDIIDAIISALPAIIEALAAALPDIIRGLAVAIPQIIEAILEALPAIIEGICNALPQIVEAIIEVLPQMVFEISKAIIVNFPQILIAIGKGLLSILIQLGEWFSGLLTKLGGWLGDILKDVWEFIKSIPGKIGEGLRGIYEAGLNLVKGLWNGISDAAGWVLDKIKGFGQTILDGIKSFFGIKSPSREMAWVGRMLDEGLAKGISQYSGVALSEAMNVADGITGAMTGMASPTVTLGAGGLGYGSTSNAITMNIYGAEGQNVNALADAVIDRLQRTIIGSEAVYA